jgi:hypothetical protein
MIEGKERLMEHESETNSMRQVPKTKADLPVYGIPENQNQPEMYLLPAKRTADQEIRVDRYHENSQSPKPSRMRAGLAFVYRSVVWKIININPCEAW